MAMERTSMGQAFVDSEEFRSYTGHGQSGRFEIEGYLDMRAAITTASLAIPHFVISPIETTFRSQLLEVVGKVTVSSGTVDWVEVGADPVAAVVTEGSAKPEATFTMTPQTAALQTIAHWVQITRQALEDATLHPVVDRVEAAARSARQSRSGHGRGTRRRHVAGGDRGRHVEVDPCRDRQGRSGRVQPERRRPQPDRLRELGHHRGVGLEQRPGSPVDVLGFAGGAGVVDHRRDGDWSATSRRGPPCSTVVSPTCSSPTRTPSLFISNILVILAEARLKSAVTEPLAICECTVA